jgi:ankyrin repeat protein
VKEFAMDDYEMYAILEAIAEAFAKLTWFSCGWFLVYAILGPWFKVKLVHLRTAEGLPSARRFGPVFVSHILFSIALVNPFIMLVIAYKLENMVDSRILDIFLIIIYFWILSLLLECLFLRVVARWKRLRWFQWRPPLKVVVTVSLLLSALGFGAGSAGVYMKGAMPTILRSFPLRPRAFKWKVDTDIKPLHDASLAAESDRMITDNKYVYVQVNAKQHQWRVVERSSHKVLEDEVEALGYVLADDLGGSWQIRRSADGLLCSRVFGKNPRTIPIAVTRDVVFLEHQIQGLIVGANPSNGYLFAFDPEKEEILWEVRAPAAKGNNDRRIGSIAGANDVITVGLWTCRVWAVDAMTGESLWQFREEGMGNAMHVVASEKAVVGFSRSGKAYAFDLRTGNSKWTGHLGDLAGGIGAGNLCLFEDRVIFRDEESVSCINVDTSETLWRSSFGNHYSGGLTCSTDGTVVCASDRTLALLDSKTGEETFRTKFPIRSGIMYGFYNRVEKTPGRIYAHPTITDDGEVYVFTGDGVLWALSGFKEHRKKGVLVIYGDKQNADGFAALLENQGLECTAIPERTAKVGLSESYDLVITLSCCSGGYYRQPWNANLLNEVGSARVLACGEAGAALLQTKALLIGYPNGWHGARSPKRILFPKTVTTGPFSTILRSPNDLLSIYGETIIEIHSGTEKLEHIGIYDGGTFPAGTQGIGREEDLHHWIICKQGNYTLWGADSRIDNLTSQGKKLFVNLCSFLAEASPEPLVFPEKQYITEDKHHGVLKGGARDEYSFIIRKTGRLKLTLEWDRDNTMMFMSRKPLTERVDGKSPLEIVHDVDEEICKKEFRLVVHSFQLPENIECPYSISISYEPHEDVIEAARQGDTAKLRSILAKDPKKGNARPSKSHTALYCAAFGGHKETVELLIDNGADVDAKSNIGYTALHAAAGTDSKEVVELLLAKGADVNAKSDLGRTCLYLPVEKGYREMTEFLIANGAEVNAKDNHGWAPLHLAVSRDQMDISRLLIGNGATVDSRNENGYTSLHTAADKGHIEIADLLIANGADVRAKAIDDTTALHWSAKAGHEDMTNLLIARGADINAQDGLGRTALSIALKMNNNGVAESLRKHGAIE